MNNKTSQLIVKYYTFDETIQNTFLFDYACVFLLNYSNTEIVRKVLKISFVTCNDRQNIAILTIINNN